MKNDVFSFCLLFIGMITENKKIKMSSKLKYEAEGRTKIQTVFPKIDWKFPTDDMSSFDAYAQHRSKTIIAEIKTRQFASSLHDDVYIEVDKVFRLFQVGEVDEVIAVYHFDNDVTCTWNLTNMTLNEEDAVLRLMNATTADKTEKVLKKVFLLQFEDADIRTTSTGQKRESRFEPLTENQKRLLNLLKQNKA